VTSLFLHASGCCREQLITEFFGLGRQASDALLSVSFFEGLRTFIDVRLSPAEQAVD
jgi:hypothetical protein